MAYLKGVAQVVVKVVQMEVVLKGEVQRVQHLVVQIPLVAALEEETSVACALVVRNQVDWVE